jgi:hypothetical protein
MCTVWYQTYNNNSQLTLSFKSIHLVCIPFQFDIPALGHNLNKKCYNLKMTVGSNVDKHLSINICANKKYVVQMFSVICSTFYEQLCICFIITNHLLVACTTCSHVTTQETMIIHNKHLQILCSSRVMLETGIKWTCTSSLCGELLPKCQ